MDLVGPSVCIISIAVNLALSTRMRDKAHPYGIRGLSSIQQLKVDLGNQMSDPKRNSFRLYSIAEYRHGTCFIFGAFYESNDDEDENYGKPIIFAVHSRID